MVNANEEALRLSKILANSTRREILEFIGQNKEVSYVEIRKTLGQMDIGTLNYHLEILTPLVCKNREQEDVF